MLGLVTLPTAKKAPSKKAIFSSSLTKSASSIFNPILIESLIKSQDSSFLFEVEQTPKFKGMSPGANKEGLPNSSGFEQRLREAREKGDNLEAIKIKQEAQKEGIVLI